MNENYNNVYNDEMEINLVNLMFYLLRQWRTLLIALIIGAVAGCGIYVGKNAGQQVSVIQEEKVDYTDYEVDPTVRANMDLASEYYLLYDKQMEYNQNSLIMNMDPNQVYCGELRYYLAAGKDTRLVAALYSTILDDMELLNAIKDAGQLDCDIQYVREILSCVSSRERGDSIEIINAADGVLENSDLGYNDAVIHFSVSYSEQEACEKMLQVIRNKVEEVTEEYQSQYNDYTIKLINSVVRLIFNNDYFTSQKAGMDALSSYLTNIAKIEAAFGEEDMAYYESQYLGRENGDLSAADAEGLQESQSEPMPMSVRDLVKWFTIGLMLGCVFWGIYHCVRYLLDKHIKTADELQYVFGLRILGKVAKSCTGKGSLDRMLAEWEKKAGSPSDTLPYIKSMVLSLNKKNILFGGNKGNESLEILQDLCAENPGFKWMGFVHQDDEALCTAKDSDGEIIVAEVGKTIFHEVRRELDVCRIQGISVLGVIVIE